MNKGMISKSAIKLILNTYIIKKRIYKRKREERGVSKTIKRLLTSYLTYTIMSQP